MIYRTVTEEDGSKNTETFRPADLHDDQNGTDKRRCDMSPDGMHMIYFADHFRSLPIDRLP
jgi:hypothetical protein